MPIIFRRAWAIAAHVIAIAIMVAPSAAPAEGEAAPNSSSIPMYLKRGLPGPGHAALEPLIGNWRVQFGVYATLGRSPDAPPVISDDHICRRQWVAGGRYMEDLTEGTVGGAPYWRKGWLGYSNMDRRYEWVTIDAVNTTMMRYEGNAGTDSTNPISMTGMFTDQGVAGEDAVGKSIGMRTVIKIESKDRHIFELYFTPPGKQEMLATRAVYTRLDK